MSISFVPRDCKVFSANVRNVTAGKITASNTVVPEVSVGVLSVSTLTVGTLTAPVITIGTVTVVNSISVVPRIKKFTYNPVALTDTTFVTSGNGNMCRIATLGTFTIGDGVSCVGVEVGNNWTLGVAASHTIALAVGGATATMVQGEHVKIMSMVPVGAFKVQGQVNPVIPSATVMFPPDVVAFPNGYTNTQYLYVARWLGSESFVTPLNFYLMFV